MPQLQQVPGSSGWEAPTAFGDARAPADFNNSQPEGLLRGVVSSELQQQVHHSQPAHMHMGKVLSSQGLGLGVHTPEQPTQQKAPGPSRAEAQQQPQHKVSSCVGLQCTPAAAASHGSMPLSLSGCAAAAGLAALSLNSGSFVGLPLA